MNDIIGFDPDPDLDLGNSGTTAAAVHAANKMAGELVKAKKFRAAKVALCRALTAAPHHHELWSNLSSVLWSLRSYEDALMCARNSLQFNSSEDPRSRYGALMCVGNSSVSLGDYETALKAFNDILENMTNPNLWRKEGEGEEHIQRILDARWNRSLLLLLMGRYREGFEGYHIRIDRDKADYEKDRRYTSPLWRGEELHGKSVLLLHDQGYGDTLMYSRFIPWLADISHKVYISVAPALIPLLYSYEERIVNLKFLPYGVPLPEVQYHTYLGSLPVEFLKMNPQAQFPPVDDGYANIRRRVQADLGDPGVAVQVPEPKGSPCLKIGICWSGRVDFARNDEREIPLRLFLALAESPAFWLYSFQMGPKSAEIDELGAEPFIYNLDKEMQGKGWIGTATAMMQMDLILTCDTSIAHLAGALGVPCWVLLHVEPYWPWGAKDSSTPWYPSVRLFRQDPYRRGDWTCVIEKVRAELYGLFKQKANSNSNSNSTRQEVCSP